MKTVIIIYVLVNYICTYLLALTWRHSKGRFAGVTLFLTNFIFQSVGMSLAVARPALPALLSVVCANMLMFSGVAAFAFGTGKFLHIAFSRKPYYAYVAVFASLYAYYTFQQPDIRMRTIIFAAMLIPVFAHIASMGLLAADKAHRAYFRHTGITFLLFAMLYAFRAYHAYTGASVPHYFQTPSFDACINVFTMLLTILLMYSLQLMINRKLFHEAERHALEQGRLLHKMERLATRDHLTGIYNRRRIEEILRHEMEQFKRYRQPFSIILCDIDKFKNINDEYGHDIGDRAIMHAVELIAANMRETDRLGRWGGEEFLIVATQLQQRQAVQAADRLRAIVACQKPEFMKDGSRITLSFGVAEYARDMPLEEIIKRADQALYRAKQGGRNRVEA